MKKIIPLLFLFPVICFAQHPNKENFAENQFTIEAGFTGAQLGAELKTGRNQTIQFRGGIAPILYTITDPVTFEDDLTVVGSIMTSAEYRAYYNFPKRSDMNKGIHNNGANYVGLLVAYVTKPLGEKNNFMEATSAFVVGPMWGFNRPLGNRGLFHLVLGPTIQREIERDRTRMVIYADARFALRLNKP